MSKALLPEIIRSVVLYLKDDKKSLYSCLLVSRDWCRETVDLLWRKPFYFLYVCSTKVPKFQFSDSCYCSPTKRKRQAANLMTTYFSIKYNDELVKEGIIKTKGENMMFNYLEFLTALDLHELDCAIRDWFQDTSLYYNSNRPDIDFLYTKLDLSAYTFSSRFEEICYSIFEFLFTRSPKLKLLSIDPKSILYEINNNKPCFCLIRYHNSHNKVIIDKLLHNVSKTPEIKQVFAKLTEFIFTGKEIIIYNLFSFLSQNSLNIQKLIAVFDCDGWVTLVNEDAVKLFASLIRSQNNLVYFEVTENLYNGTNEILKALVETQYNSLKVLILNDVYVSDDNSILFYLKDLQNLEELRLNGCIKCSTNEGSKKMKSSNSWEDLCLPNLKYLEVNFNYKNYSKELFSILLRCSPLINRI